MNRLNCILLRIILLLARPAGWSVDWVLVKKVVSFTAFYGLLAALIRMWWKIGSYYGRKNP